MTNVINKSRKTQSLGSHSTRQTPTFLKLTFKKWEMGMLGPQRAFPSGATSSPIFSLAGSLSPAAPLGLLPKSRLPQGLPSPAMLVPVGLRCS